MAEQVLHIQRPVNPRLSGSIFLPGSKSLSNRALIIRALCGQSFPIHNLSEADDTRILLNALETDLNIIDTGSAGTAMRFLTAYLSIREGEYILTGNTRMQERPVGVLVEALRTLGASIDYLSKEGFPPLKIKGSSLNQKARLVVQGNISSQFISALLLIAPRLPDGLTLEWEDNLVSRPYVEMTLRMLRYFGVSCQYTDHGVHIPQQEYMAREYTAEPDWSAASYWYAMAALSEDVNLQLEKLEPGSMQGDCAVASRMEAFGIRTEFKSTGAYLSRKNEFFYPKAMDFRETPDLAQTFICLCAFKRLDARFTGLETLPFKETDRISALQAELAKTGVQFTEKNGIFSLDCKTMHVSEDIIFDAWGDHRMAMSLLPLCMVTGSVKIRGAGTVAKSYPGFWKDLQSIGFNITEL